MITNKLNVCVASNQLLAMTDTHFGSGIPKFQYYGVGSQILRSS